MDSIDWRKTGAVTLGFGSFFAVVIGAPLLVSTHATDSRLQLRLELKSDNAKITNHVNQSVSDNRNLFIRAVERTERNFQSQVKLLNKQMKDRIAALERRIDQQGVAIEVMQSLLFEGREPPRKDRDHQGEYNAQRY